MDLKTKKIALRGKEYPITIEGEGTPCLVIGIATLMQRTLSSEIKKFLQCYYADICSWC